MYDTGAVLQMLCGGLHVRIAQGDGLKMMVQGGPLVLINGGITPCKSPYKWGYNPTYRDYITPFVTIVGAHHSTWKGARNTS